jgi:hypothetical protein
MVPSKRIDVFAKQWRDVAQGFVINLVSVSPQLADNLTDLNHVPGNHGVVLIMRPYLVMGLICATDQPFHFRFVKTLHSSPAIADRLQFQAAARLLDYVFGLVISKMVLAPEPGRLRNDVSQPRRNCAFVELPRTFARFGRLRPAI